MRVIYRPRLSHHHHTHAIHHVVHHGHQGGRGFGHWLRKEFHKAGGFLKKHIEPLAKEAFGAASKAGVAALTGGSGSLKDNLIAAGKAAASAGASSAKAGAKKALTGGRVGKKHHHHHHRPF